MLDNIDVAILTKLNELAERRGLKPYDFVATLKWREDQDLYALCFEAPATGNSLQVQRFALLLRDLGVVVDDSAELRGSVKKIVDALDNALQLSSRARRPR